MCTSKPDICYLYRIANRNGYDEKLFLGFERYISTHLVHWESLWSTFDLIIYKENDIESV